MSYNLVLSDDAKKQLKNHPKISLGWFSSFLLFPISTKHSYS